MAEKVDTRYILKHKVSGFYVTSSTSFTTEISNAKLWQPNHKIDADKWNDIYDTEVYEVIMRTETITVKYEGVDFE